MKFRIPERVAILALLTAFMFANPALSERASYKNTLKLNRTNSGNQEVLSTRKKQNKKVRNSLNRISNNVNRRSLRVRARSTGDIIDNGDGTCSAAGQTLTLGEGGACSDYAFCDDLFKPVGQCDLPEEINCSFERANGTSVSITITSTPDEPDSCSRYRLCDGIDVFHEDIPCPAPLPQIPYYCPTEGHSALCDYNSYLDWYNYCVATNDNESSDVCTGANNGVTVIPPHPVEPLICTAALANLSCEDLEDGTPQGCVDGAGDVPTCVPCSAESIIGCSRDDYEIWYCLQSGTEATELCQSRSDISGTEGRSLFSRKRKR